MTAPARQLYRRDGIEVIALLGPAGTGKSHRALLVARSLDIPAVIDDGLLIEGGKIRAGRSAKGARNRIEAVRLAIFAHPDHAEAVGRAIDAIRPPRLLVLGTSRAMIDRICEHLGLAQPSRIVDITEVARPEEIEEALRSRREEGKHVIPAPAFEVKRRFAQQLVAPLLLWYRGANSAEREVVEKSVVRPTYTSLGRLFIEQRVIQALFERLLSEQPIVAAVQRSQVEVREDGVLLAADVTIRWLPDQLGQLRAAQQEVGRRLEDMAAVNVMALDLTARSVVPADEGLPLPDTGTGS